MISLAVVNELMKVTYSISTWLSSRQLLTVLTRPFFSIVVAFIAALGAPAMAADSYLKQWDNLVITGSITNSHYQYYFEPQIRFIDDTYVFNELFLLGALGYRVNSSLSFFVGPGWIITKNTDGSMSHEVRLWQQLNYLAISKATFNLNARTRFEQRKDTQYSTIAYRFRQRLWLRVPFKSHPSLSFSIFDEIFLNFNHPQWVSPHFFSQNRAFIGLGYQYSKALSIDTGYMNQFLNSTTSRDDHVLVVICSINN